MESSYVLCIKDGLKKSGYNTNYYLPVDLAMLDCYFTTMESEEILNMLRKIDPVLQLTKMEQISIKKVVDGKYIDEKFTEVTTDSRVLSIQIEPLLLDPIKGDKRAHILLNYLLPFQKRIVSEEFKQAIESLKNDKTEFLQRYTTLPYNEKRIVHSIAIKHILNNVKSINSESKEEPLNLKKRVV